MRMLSKLIVSCAIAVAGSVSAAERPVVVAVIDSGIDDRLIGSPMLCKSGHRDFTDTSLSDRAGHGTHISGLIDQHVKNKFITDSYSARSVKEQRANYCQVIIKFYDPYMDRANTISAMIDSIKWAIELNVDVINISAGGPVPNEEEQKYIKYALDKGIKIVAAAGNDGCDLGTASYSCDRMKTKKVECKYFPAMYDGRITVVGNGQQSATRNPSSNYGPYVSSWEDGTNAVSYGIHAETSTETGTSQATAIKTGKIVNSMIKIPIPR